MPYRAINLNRKYQALIDERDFSVVSKYKWHITEYKRGSVVYVRAATTLPRCNSLNRTVFLHHVICGRPLNGLMIDHINGNQLDNRRENLRIVTRSQNMMNSKKPARSSASSRYKGVRFEKKQGKFWSFIGNGKGTMKYLGSFDSEKDAAIVYDKEAKKIFGKYARLNFPEGVIA